MEKRDFFFQNYLKLEEDVLEVARYIFFTDSQLTVYSPYIGDLVVRCAIEIEAIAKELYFDSDVANRKELGKNIYFDTDCLAYMDQNYKTSKKGLFVFNPLFDFREESTQILYPLKNAHRTNKNHWKKAYQALKHDRYQNLEKGTIKALLGALGALFLLNIYYKKPSWTCRYRDLEDIDYRLGSSIFSVQPPQVQNLWEEKVDLSEGSPFIARYHEDSLLEIQKIEMEVEEGIKDFLYTQPEIRDEDFCDHLNKAFTGESHSKKSLMAIVMEWGKYRLNKKIPQELSFEERKRLFMNSEEWQGKIYQGNHQMEEENLVEENIQSEIDGAGALWGVERTRYMYKTSQWLNAVNHGMCTVSILKIEDIRE